MEDEEITCWFGGRFERSNLRIGLGKYETRVSLDIGLQLYGLMAELLNCLTGHFLLFLIEEEMSYKKLDFNQNGRNLNEPNIWSQFKVGANVSPLS